MSPFFQIQLDFLYLLQNFRESGPAWINSVLVFLSEGGILLLPLVCANTFWAADKKKGLYVMYAFVFAFLANGILKLACCIYRPWVLDSRLYVAAEAAEEATGYSFPSAHCTMCASILGGVAFAWPKKRRMTVIAVAVTVIIMFARMYLGAHTPLDVLVGAGLGVLFCLLFLPILRRNTDDTGAGLQKVSCTVPGDQKHSFEYFGSWKWAVLLLACCAATVIFVQVKGYPLDYVNGELLVDPEAMKVDTFAAVGIMAGMAPGLLLERRFIRFEMPASGGKAFLRVLLGSIGFALIYAVIAKKLVAGLNPNIGKAIRYFLVIFFTTAIYPWIISRCRGKL